MGRVGGRSKGCAICRQRRVKCDEAQPECRQCLRTGRRCPGATAGNVFINISPETQAGASQSTLEVPPDNRPKAASEPARSTTRSRAASKNASDGDDSTPSNSMALLGQREPQIRHFTDAETLAVSMEDIGSMELPTWYQPSKADIFQMHFTSHFIGNFFNPSSYRTRTNLWVFHIPAIIYSSPSPAAQSSIRAATMAFYGSQVGDVALQIEASRWYGKGLSQQRMELDEISNNPSNQEVNITALLAPLMFSMFETVMVTNANGWCQHLHAASRILELIGPEACQDGVANSLFRSIRVGMIFIIMSWRKPPFMASETWCTVPFQQRPKTIFDVLDDILFQLPACYSLRSKWRDLTEALDPEAGVLKYQIKAMAQDLKSKLDWFWSYYGMHLQGITPLDESEFENLPSVFTVPRTSFRGNPMFSCPNAFRDTFAAQTIAKFNAGSLLAYGLLRSMRPKNDGFDDEIEIHGESILAAVTYQESSGPSQSGCISMIFPLRILVVEAVSDVQRRSAQEAVRTWGKRRGVEKLCNLQTSAPPGEKRRLPFHYADHNEIAYT